MSELFRESIIDGRKLREVAATEARNRIIESISPIIKKMIAKEAANTNQFLFGEEDLPGVGDMDPGLPGPSPTLGDTGSVAPISPTGDLVGMPMPDEEGKITVDFAQLFTPSSASPAGGMESGILGNDPLKSEIPPVAPGSEMPGAMPPAGEAAPVAPVEPIAPPIPGPEVAGGAPQAAQAGIAPPGVGSQPPVPGGPAPTPEEEEALRPLMAGEARLRSFTNNVLLVAEKVDYVYFRGNIPSIVKETLKSRLFTLCEQLDQLTNDGVVSGKKAKIAENKLEFLFLKLNEAKENNSYMGKGNHMSTQSLKEFAAKLFEEDALGPATADKATAHAEKVSGVQPGVDLLTKEAAEMKEIAESLLGEDAPASSAFGDGKKEGDAETKSDKVKDEDALVKEKGAGIVESAPASTAFGDGKKEAGSETIKTLDGERLVDEKGANSILEFDEKELREAVAKLRKENLAKKLAGVKQEAALKGTDKDGHLKTPSVPEGDQGSVKPEGGKAPAQKELKECDMPEGMPAGLDAVGGGSDVGVDLPDLGGDAGGEPGAGGGEVELSFSIDIDDLEALLSGGAAKFEVEPTSGEGPEGVADVVNKGGEGDELLLGGEDEAVKDEAAMPAAAPAVSSGMKESKKLEEANKKIVALNKSLNEYKLLTAKSVYVSKFTVREDLSSKQKQKIVQYFDKASSLAEAKEVYTRITKVLSESRKNATTNLTSSASKPTSTGGAKLQESVSGQPDNSSGSDKNGIEVQRWQLLAGIKGKK